MNWMIQKVLIAFRLQSEFGRIDWHLENRRHLPGCLNRLSASVRIWTVRRPIIIARRHALVLIAFRLQSEFGRGLAFRMPHGGYVRLNRLSASVRIWTKELEKQRARKRALS